MEWHIYVVVQSDSIVDCNSRRYLRRSNVELRDHSNCKDMQFLKYLIAEISLNYNNCTPTVVRLMNRHTHAYIYIYI